MMATEENTYVPSSASAVNPNTYVPSSTFATRGTKTKKNPVPGVESAPLSAESYVSSSAFAGIPPATPAEPTTETEKSKFTATDGTEFDSETSYKSYQRYLDDQNRTNIATQENRVSAFNILKDEFDKY
jgi:hypothetical protein